MAADIGRGYIESRIYLLKVCLRFYDISSCCRAIRRIVLAQCGSAKAERGQSMKTKANQITGTINPSTLNYAHPYYVPIDDGDETTIKYYKSYSVPIAHIALPGRMPHYYAVFDAPTQAEADMMKKLYNNWDKKSSRDDAKKKKFETSYEQLAEDGYEPNDKQSDNPEEIVAYNMVLDELYAELSELTEEKRRLCSMVANKQPERQVAEEMGITQSTLNGRKKGTLKELKARLNKYM